MPIYKLRPEQIEGFANGPEVDMGIQVGLDSGDSPLVVASGRIAIRYDGEFGDQLELYQEFVGLGRDSFRIDDYGSRLETWVNILPDCPPITPMSAGPARTLLPFIHLGPRGPLLPPAWRPPYVYGHLPFHGRCGGQDIYYRYEQFSTSKRIDLSSNQVTKPDTYATPASERDFTPTGLSAVGRFALPSLLPACWRYELTPMPGTRLFYGASVPLYGQSGGAVEVMFPDPFKNNGPIRAPTILPIL
jgi:hypothetical protein